MNLLTFLHSMFLVSAFSNMVFSATPITIPGICESMLKPYGYPCEEHTVTTKDGYILSIQRIPHGRTNASKCTQNKTPVLLQHGVFMDGVTWFLNESPEDSLGYVLADSGYDVWIANGRGTVFSRQHNDLTRFSSYWDWTWDELVEYDLRTTYDYVYRHSGRRKIHYLGHSLGTLIALASFCQMKLVNMTRSAAFLSPIAFLDRVNSPLARNVAELYMVEAFYKLGFDEFAPTAEPVHAMLQEYCKLPGSDCNDLVTSFTGKNCCLNSSTINRYLEHEPQSSSTKNVIHLCQMVRRGTIAKYDYGNCKDNMKHYGQSFPPIYNLSGFPNDLPVFLAHGGEDGLSDVADVKHLVNTLKLHDTAKLKILFRSEYAHGDFIMGNTARKIIYDPLLKFLSFH